MSLKRAAQTKFKTHLHTDYPFYFEFDVWKF